MGFEGLFEHKAGLRQGAFRRIDQKHHAVDHFESPLHLTAEISMARGINNVDFNALPINRTVFRRNGNAALALKIHTVHHPVSGGLILAKTATLPKHMVNQGGFTVVNVGDNGDVANIGIMGYGFHFTYNS